MTVPKSTWGIYATRVWELEQRKGHQIHDRNRCEEAVACDGIRRLTDQAVDWWTQFDLTPYRLAEALVDGKPPRYAERRLS